MPDELNMAALPAGGGDPKSPSAVILRVRPPWWIWLLLALTVAGAVATFIEWPHRAEAVGVWVGAAVMLIVGSNVAVRVKETSGRAVETDEKAQEASTPQAGRADSCGDVADAGGDRPDGE